LPNKYRTEELNRLFPGWSSYFFRFMKSCLETCVEGNSRIGYSRDTLTRARTGGDTPTESAHYTITGTSCG
jgi:hypothetical protein